MFTHLVRSVFRLGLNQSTFFFTLSLKLKTGMNSAINTSSDSTQRQHLCLYCVQTLTTVACGFKQLGRASGGMASIKSALMSSACNKDTTCRHLWISFICLFVFFCVMPWKWLRSLTQSWSEATLCEVIPKLIWTKLENGMCDVFITGSNCHEASWEQAKFSRLFLGLLYPLMTSSTGQ